MRVLRIRSRAAFVVCKPFGLALAAVLLFFFANTGHAQLTFPMTDLGQSSAPVTVLVPLKNAGIAALPVLTSQNVLQGEFTLSLGGSCVAGLSVLTGQQCSVQVTFTPSAPGLRQGAVMILDLSGKLLGEVMLSGVGKGPLPVLDPGDINTVAGDGDWLYHGDGALATFSPIFLPTGVIVDALGNIYLSDSNNNRIRRVDALTGVITTVAGNGLLGFYGDGLPAVLAEVSTPAGLTMDGAGNIYFADTGNHAIRRIDALTGIITTVAGQGGVEGYEGDGGPATAANLSFPEAVVFDLAGNMYIADTGNNVVRVVGANGKISTFAGTGVEGYNGDGIAASTAQLNSPWGLASSLDGSLYIADLTNNRVRKVNATGVISTVVGTGVGDFGGDGGPASAALVKAPAAVAIDPAGNLYIADSGNNRVRKIFANTGNISTISGANSEEFSGDLGPAIAATMYGPYALSLDSAGDLFVADLFHNRIREIYAMHIDELYATMRVGKVSSPVSVPLANDGNADLQLTQFFSNNAALDPATTTCVAGSTLTAGSDCVLGAEFAPTVVGDPVAGIIVAENSAQSTPISPAPTINLSGTVLSVNPTAISLTSSLNPVAFSNSVTFNATVTGAVSLTGTVTFFNGATQLCQMALAGLSASCVTSTLPLGSDSITAVYSGDAQDAACTSPKLVEVVKQQPDYLMTVSPNPALVGQTITMAFNAPVLAQGAQPVTGTVVFYDGPTALGNAPLINGTATFVTSSLTVGTHQLVGVASGDATNLGGTSNVIPEIVQPQSTTTLLSLSTASVMVGSAVSFSATVTNGTATVPTGSVRFNDGSISLGSVALNGSGVAGLSLNTLAPGVHSITAIYSGDAGNQGSQSPALTQTVQQITTTTALSASANPLSAGATLQLSVHVTAASGNNGGSLGGSVTFTDGANALGQVAVDAYGNAVLSINTLTVATHTIVATYSGSTNYVGSVSSSLQLVVQVTSTTTTLNASASSTLAGEPVNLSINVSSSTGTPTGTVAIHDGLATVGSGVLNAQGVATVSLSTLAVGVHTLTAAYSGDNQYLTSTSNALQETISLATTALTISGPTAPVNAGLTFAVSSTLSTSGVTPTGTVSLLDGGKTIASQVASATLTFAGLGLGVGTHSLVVSYPGDANNAPATSTALILVVQQGVSTETLISSLNPAPLGQSVVVTATVSSVSPNVSGAISFMDGATLLAAVPVNAAGVATYASSSLVLGTHTITAAYGGDSNHAASNVASLSQLIVQPSQLVVSSSVNPSIAGNTVAFTAKVVGSGNNVPTGSLTFTDGSVLLGSAPLDATGAATVQSATLSVGSHTITVNYAGDNNYYAATGTLLQIVQSATTQIVLNTSANPTIYGKPLSLTATLGSNGGTATGSVDFTVDGKVLGSGLLNTGGVATFTTASLQPGSHVVVANYAGDGRAGAATSAALTETVLEMATVALSSSVNPTATLAPITLTAAVSNSQVGVPTGSITFTDGAVTLGTTPLDAAGTASLTLPSLAAGSHGLVATYTGDVDDFPATSPALTEIVNLQPTTTTMTSAANDPTNAQSVLLIAVVHAATTTAPTGSITFTIGSQTLGSSSVDATGVATLSVVLPAGTINITATYSGDSVYASSSSQITGITGGPATQFAMQLAPPTLTMVTKQHGVSTLTVTSLGSFTDTLEFGCLGLPFAATCTFSKSTEGLNAGASVQVQLTVDTGDPLGAGALAQRRTADSQIALCLLPAALLLSLNLRRRGARPIATLALALFAAFITLSATGCAGLQESSTPAGTYNFKVTASGKGTGITQSQTMTMTVTP
ncbi:Ig-like domain repeat protein [Granulicella paludicola]|uniref:Ig-like domain repeat protein n=1 Tax=Granulicella paludicola TaxID=474951 RepID=UPI0021DF9C8F|nr:Ig-like domain repeat protein [Granulicella paludicola]